MKLLAVLQAMEAALGNSKDYSLKQYLKFADKLQSKAKVLFNNDGVYWKSPHCQPQFLGYGLYSCWVISFKANQF